jgi:hypothetical protein
VVTARSFTVAKETSQKPSRNECSKPLENPTKSVLTALKSLADPSHMPQKIADASRKKKTTKEAAKTMPIPTAKSSVLSATRKVVMPTLVLPVEVEMVAAMAAVVDAMAEVNEVVVVSTRR